jgi:beta-glucosidase
MRTVLASLLVLLFFSPLAHAQLSEPEIGLLVQRMTLEEKVKFLGGNDFETFAIPRLGIPPLKMTDGPLGVHYERATAFPAGIAYGATFDPALIERMAVAIADEARFKGREMLLGPCVNISRHPFGGRNFESYGEDPFLTGSLAEAFVRGVQSREVLASVKHFAVNDQEFERMTVNVSVDPRALNEIYLPPFRRAVQAGAGSVMAAYNQVNGHYASENGDLLNRILKEKWGYSGFVVSDWGATHSTVAAANNGLDLEMPSGEFFNDKLVQAVREGGVSPAILDDKVRRVLRAMAKVDLIGPPGGRFLPPPAGPADAGHRSLAREVAVASAVLLKNEGAVLPLQPGLRKLAVLGPNSAELRTGGGGSSHVDPFEYVSPLDGLREEAGARGFALESVTGVPLPGEGESDIPSAVKAARSAEAAVIFAGLSDQIESEGFDRTTMDLPAGQAELIRAVGAANSNTIVVLFSGNPVEMASWIGSVKGVVQLWYPGEEGGHAIADLLFGKENFSGKLPVTFLKRWEDSPAYGSYPGANGQLAYKEGVFVGYRHFDSRGVAPLFPFGFGLSYTSFRIADLELSPLPGNGLRVSVAVTNTGRRAGAEVVQVYLGEKAPLLPRPVHELKGFRKVFLAPGESRRVEFELGPDAFAYFDPALGDFQGHAGEFRVEVGSSSRDLPVSGTFLRRPMVVD